MTPRGCDACSPNPALTAPPGWKHRGHSSCWKRCLISFLEVSGPSRHGVRRGAALVAFSLDCPAAAAFLPRYGRVAGEFWMTDIELVQQLEERSRLDSERVVRLTGNVDGEPFELLIFRGFSSSTTHPTAFDPDASVLPPETRLEQVELLQGPLNPSNAVVLAGPMSPADLLVQTNW